MHLPIHPLRLLLIISSLLITVCVALPAYSVVEDVSFDDPKTEKRYKSLITELRCLVCQNQSIAGSDADLAKDLRRKTIEMLKDGATDNEVRAYMTERYGDFILYRPPFNLTTAFLWLGPLILLLCIFVGIFLHIRKQQQDEMFATTHAQNEENKVKIRNLLKDAPQLDQPDDKADK